MDDVAFSLKLLIRLQHEEEEGGGDDIFGVEKVEHGVVLSEVGKEYVFRVLVVNPLEELLVDGVAFAAESG